MQIRRWLGQWMPKTSFGKGVLSIAQGAVLGQFLVLAASPALTRLYDTDDFGAFGVIASLLGILAVVASLRYQIAIPLPEEDSKAMALVALSLLTLLGVSGITAIAVWAAGGWIAARTHASAMKGLLWMVPVGVLLMGAHQVLEYWALREKAFNSIGRGKTVQGGARAALQLAMRVATSGPGGLVGGYVLGHASAVGVLAGGIRRERGSLLHQVTFSQVKHVAWEFRRFPLYSSWSGLFNALSMQLPVLLLASLFGLDVAGLYSLTRQILAAPLQLVGQSIAQAFLSEAPAAVRDGSIGRLSLTIFERLVKLATPAALVLAIAAPEIVSFLFGFRWRTAGIYCQWLTPWLFFVFVSSPLSMIPSVMGRQRAELVFHGSVLALRAAAILAGAAVDSATVALTAFAGISALLWVVFMLWNMNLSGNSTRDVLAVLIRELAANVPLFLPLAVGMILGCRGACVVGLTALTGVLVAVRLLVSLRRAKGRERGSSA